ncbi:hypothetical protein RJ641_034950 [Dillenia turbinata]|uniref:Uncharacterized protein n=1 Tax=Dillenia turbinata TaxID=194707 RepID=A0AAN8VIE1_9MAGN
MGIENILPLHCLHSGQAPYAMATSDLWKREYIDASKLADEINGMISATPSLPDSSPEKKRHTSASRRKTAILRTKLVTLESLLSKHPVLSSAIEITGGRRRKREEGKEERRGSGSHH